MSHFKKQLWYLDLEGTRSGPYAFDTVQTLIAEGEVLPHHKISTALKDTDWVTILDWRLDLAQQLEEQEEDPFSNQTSTPPPTISSPPISEPPPITETPIQSQTQLGKSDPTAEMFALLQSARSKKESIKTQSAVSTPQQKPNQKTEEKIQSSKIKNFLIGLGVILFGFSIGQWFKSQSTPPPTIQSPALETQTAQPHESSTTRTDLQVVDRSNEKLTIRGYVQTTPTPQPSPQAQATKSKALDSELQSELEEIRELKKELKELRELREKLKHSDSFDDSGVEDPRFGPPSNTREGLSPEALPENGPEFDPNDPYSNPMMQPPVTR